MAARAPGRGQAERAALPPPGARPHPVRRSPRTPRDSSPARPAPATRHGGRGAGNGVPAGPPRSRFPGLGLTCAQEAARSWNSRPGAPGKGWRPGLKVCLPLLRPGPASRLVPCEVAAPAARGEAAENGRLSLCPARAGGRFPPRDGDSGQESVQRWPAGPGVESVKRCRVHSPTLPARPLAFGHVAQVFSGLPCRHPWPGGPS